MNIERLNRDEFHSHLAEIVNDQDSKIVDLIQQRRALALLAAIAITWNLIF